MLQESFAVLSLASPLLAVVARLRSSVDAI